MAETVGVVIATFGDFGHWSEVAAGAERSVIRQERPPDDYVRIHRSHSRLDEVRNEGARSLSTDLIVFLDADDMLDPGYLRVMTSGGGHIRKPATLDINAPDAVPGLIKELPLSRGNHIVVGAAVDREFFEEVGGFDDWPIYEDWALWLKMVQRGATVTSHPEAVYQVSLTESGRNSQDRSIQMDVYNRIRKTYLPQGALR